MMSVLYEKSILYIGLLLAIVGISFGAYAQTPDFTAKCGGVKYTPPRGTPREERPLLVILLKPDDPFKHPQTQMSLFALKGDGYIHQKIFDMLEPVSDAIHFQTHNGKYLVAENGGGGAIEADSITPTDWETFTVIDINGNQLDSGDMVYLKTHDGKHFLTAENGGGQKLKADGTSAGMQATFMIMKDSKGPIRHGDKIALRTLGGYYVVAEGGGDGEVNADRIAKGIWETFTVKSKRSPWCKNIVLPKNQRLQSAPVTTNYRELQSVFALGVDGYIHQTLYSAYDYVSTWKDWSKLPGNTKFAYAPAAISTLDGDLLTVFATGLDGYVYQTIYWRKSGSHWSKEWSKLPGSQKFESAPTAFNTPDGKILSVMATGVDGYIYQTIYSRSAGSHWSKWVKLPGTQEFESAPTTFNTPDGKILSIMATGTDGYIYQNIYTRGTGSHWSKWTKLSGTLKFKSAPWSMNSVDGKLAIVYALGEDSVIYERVYMRGRGSYWTAWEPIPGEDSYDSGATAMNPLEPLKKPEYFRNMLFGATNSVRGYFHENSYGKFTFREAAITPWLTTKDDPTTPLDESSFDYLHAFDGKEKSLERKSSWIIGLVEEMTSFDFAEYDANNDGKVTYDELSVLWIYPGGGDARGRDLMPSLVKVPSLSKGVEIGMLIRGGTAMSMMTVCHELGHQALKLGDLYRLPEESYPKVGKFSLMSEEDRGSHLDPWSKIKLGWIENPMVIEHDRWVNNLRSVERYPEVCILYNQKKGKNEYFIVENRWPDNSYEAELPDRGLAIWHINENTCNGGYDSRKTIQLVSPVAGSLQLWDGADPKSAYDFTPSSSPANSNWFDGTPSGISVKNIPTASPQAKFYIDVP